MDLWYKCEVLLLLDSVGCCYLCLLMWNLSVLLLGVLWKCDCFLWHWRFDFYGLKTLSFRELLVSPMYSAVQLLVRHFQWYIIAVLWASGIGSFECTSKDLMMLVPLKKTLALHFARVHLYCSLRPLMYGMTTLASSINFPVDGFGSLLVFCWGFPCWERTVLVVVVL